MLIPNEGTFALPADPEHRALVVIPTVADPTVLIPTVSRILADAEMGRDAGLLPIALVLSINAKDAAHAEESTRTALAMVQVSNARGRCLDLLVVRAHGPIGFGAANNRGMMGAVREWGGVPELTVFHNDDAHASHGWLDGLLAALRSDTVCSYGDPTWNPSDAKTSRQRRPVAGYGPLGIVGPVSNLVAGIQAQTTVFSSRFGRVDWKGDVDHMAAAVADRHAGDVVTADFISGFCVGFGRGALSDLMLQVHPDGGSLIPAIGMMHAGFAIEPSTPEILTHAGALVGPWDEVSYPIAGYEDNDVCVRAELAGWRCAVAAGVFVGHLGHQTFDRMFPEMDRGLRNRMSYYARWQGLTNPDRPLRVCATYRLRFEVGHDLHLMRSSLQRVAQLLDDVTILLTDNPLAVRDDIRWEQEEALLTDVDREMLAGCSGADANTVAAYVRAWAGAILATAPDTRFPADAAAAADRVRCEVWLQPFNEREERNRSIAMAEGTGADWILSVDHDEVIENRIGRGVFEALMRHPDPLVRAWDQGWLNHWDTPRMVREDAPWGDGGKYVGGMHGFRFWRVPRKPDGTIVRSPRRIISGTDNGLHCGNSPDHDLVSKRVSGIRFRHFGYTRDQDRRRKHLRYQEQDPHANATLTGGAGKDGYGHILHEEGARFSPFVAVNGIALHVLLYRGEKASALAALLDNIRGVVDRVVLVWTGPWTDADKAWLMAPDPAEVAREAERDALRAQLVEAGRPAPQRLRAAQQGDAEAVPADVATGPTRDHARIAEWFGCEWIHQPLDEDLAGARNAGLDAIAIRARALGTGWSLFFDLDEVLSAPYQDAVCLRRMAECSDAHGWMFAFNNHHKGGPSRSESIRMARMIPEMRFAGRVHESFDGSLAVLSETKDITVRVAPFAVDHFGLALDDAGLKRKMTGYQRKLLLQLEDDPHDGSAWVSLALHYFNDDRHDKGLECLERAVACPGRGYLPFRELAMYHLRRGTLMLSEAIRRSSPAHDWRKATEPLLRTLKREIPEFPILGREPGGPPVCPDVDLPPFTAPEAIEMGPAPFRQGRR